MLALYALCRWINLWFDSILFISVLSIIIHISITFCFRHFLDSFFPIMSAIITIAVIYTIITIISTIITLWLAQFTDFSRVPISTLFFIFSLIFVLYFIFKVALTMQGSTSSGLFLILNNILLCISTVYITFMRKKSTRNQDIRTASLSGMLLLR